MVFSGEGNDSKESGHEVPSFITNEFWQIARIHAFASLTRMPGSEGAQIKH